MRAWRVFPHRAAWARAPGFDPLDGAGGLVGPGRWHRLGVRMTYASASPSLATLETLVHLVPQRFGERTLVEIDVPDDAIEVVSHAVLVQLLRDAPPGEPEAATRRFGSAWAAEARTLALRAPSVLMPFEENLILNPLHPRMAELRILRREILTLDPRLASSLAARAQPER